MKLTRRIISPKGLLIFLCLTVILLAAGSQKVSAEEQKQYLIKVNRAYNTITVYVGDEKGEYTIPVKAMACSVGKYGRTITGTFQTKEKYRWKLLMGDVYGQYATRIVGGILFHSVYYYQNGNPATLASKEYNKLGTAASHGCIRLSVEDAKWIYDNCSSGTTVIIYDDKKSAGPLGKPGTIKIPETVRWDPTDPSEKNPYKETMPKINGAKDLVLELGEKIDLLKGITAKSSFGHDISERIKMESTVDYNEPGIYTVAYSITDDMKRVGTKIITVTIEEAKADPEFQGISEKLVTNQEVIDEKFALSGVDLYRGSRKLDKDLIQVTIEKIDEENYNLIYTATVGDIVITRNSSVHIDKEAPVITGVSDITLEAGEVPTKAYVSEGVTATDNYTAAKDLTFTVSISENTDGTYLITYTAKDEAGNITTLTANVIQ